MKKLIVLIVSALNLLLLVSPTYADVIVPTKTSFQFSKNGEDITNKVEFTYSCYGCSYYDYNSIESCTDEVATLFSEMSLDCTTRNCYTLEPNYHGKYITNRCSLKGKISGKSFDVYSARKPNNLVDCIYKPQYDMSRSYNEGGESITKYYNYSQAWDESCKDKSEEVMETNGCLDLDKQENISKYLIELDENSFEKDLSGYALLSFCNYSFDLSAVDIEESSYTDTDATTNQTSTSTDNTSIPSTDEDRNNDGLIQNNNQLSNGINLTYIYLIVGGLILFNAFVITVIILIIKLRKK